MSIILNDIPESETKPKTYKQILKVAKEKSTPEDFEKFKEILDDIVNHG